jgi:hypothetical protein
LKFYHFGAAESTATKYNGVDMRGEVVSLSRNIKIIGENVENWGCQILTADVFEDDGKDGILRAGETRIDSVELDNCGQIDSANAAFRFENALTNSHEIRNSAIHSSHGWGLNVLRSKNLIFDNNVMWQFK